MKDTLEYKILKYLSENEVEELIDVSHLDNNIGNLTRKLSYLRREKYILVKKNNDKSIVAKIEFKGTEYLSKLEKIIVTEKIEQLTLKKLKFEQFPAKFWWLILIISGVISILTTWVNNQISESTNQQEQPKTEKPLQK